jgi:2-polyprenyl-3-methyl-5-hydroxy-6-metoxy-1,4-benzoquinol methylase
LSGLEDRVDNAEAIRRWAEISREDIEAFGDEGDLARQYLLNPHLFRLLGPVVGRRILDAGCGTGYLTRWLARQGAHAVGVEPARPLYEYCREREQAEPLGITYLPEDLVTLDHPPYDFDAVVASMVLMDIPDDEAAMRACFRHARVGGQVIIALSHPCFEDNDKTFQEQGAVVVREYFAAYRIPQRYGDRIHRPLSHYLNLIIQSGGVIQEVVEPQLNVKDVAQLPGAVRHAHVPGFVLVRATKMHVRAVVDFVEN